MSDTTHPPIRFLRRSADGSTLRYADAEGNECLSRLDHLLIKHAWLNGVYLGDLVDGPGAGDSGKLSWLTIRDSSEVATVTMLERCLNRYLETIDLEWLNEAAKADEKRRRRDPEAPMSVEDFRGYLSS